MLVFCPSPRLENRTWFDRHGKKFIFTFYLSGMLFMFSPFIYNIYKSFQPSEAREIYRVSSLLLFQAAIIHLTKIFISG
jgi:hypothetical protein